MRNLYRISVLFMVTAAFFVGCNKGSSSSSNPVPVAISPYGINGIYGTNGVNNGLGGTPILTNAQASYQGSQGNMMTASINLLAVNSGFGGGMGMGSMSPSQYSGPVAIQGQMQIAYPDLSMCYAPAGIYTLSSVTPSQSIMGVISGGQVIATGTGGAQLTITIGTSEIYTENTRLGLNMVINSINGQYCGSQISTY